MEKFKKPSKRLKSRGPMSIQSSKLTYMTKQVFETSWWRDHIIELLEAWWNIVDGSLSLFMHNVVKDPCLGSVFGNQFRFMLMYGISWVKSSTYTPDFQYWLEYWQCGVYIQ